MEIEFRIALVARDLHTGNFRKRQTDKRYWTKWFVQSVKR
jgi:hypothetical protein